MTSNFTLFQSLFTQDWKKNSTWSQGQTGNFDEICTFKILWTWNQNNSWKKQYLTNGNINTFLLDMFGISYIFGFFSW